jgi:site-specific DNA recombinase
MSKIIKHVALYLRISQEKKDENRETLENHRQLLIEFAENQGYTYEIFGEVVSGGKSDLEERKELLRLLENIEKFDAIVCVELSRLSRNGLISQTVKQYCIDYDKPILTPFGQKYDLANSETDRLMFDVGSMISSHEHAVIGKRSKMNKKQMTKAGLHVSGNVPFGYKRNPETKKLEIDEEAAKIVRYIFYLHSLGYGSHKIRDILNDEGYRSPTGKHFNIPSIKRIIRNPHYKGWTVFNDRKRIKENGKYKYVVVDTIVVKDTHPAIIPPEEWDKANKDRIERYKKAQAIREKPATKTGVTMLKDLVYCGLCGRKMSIRKDNKSSTNYTIKKCEYLNLDGSKCNNFGIKLSHVEEEVHKNLLKYKEDCIKRLKELEKKDLNKIKEIRQQKLKQLSKRIKEVSDQEKKLIDLAVSGIFSNEEIKEKKQELIEEKRQLEIEYESLKQEDESMRIEEEKRELKRIISIIDMLPELDAESINRYLKTFIKKIYYKRAIPEEIAKLSTRNSKRKDYPFKIKIEYFD